MFWTDIIGAALTLFSLLALGAGGFLLAVLILRQSAREDRLALAIASIICTGALGLSTIFILGLMRVLYFPLALAVQSTLVLGLAVWVRNTAACEPASAAFTGLFQRIYARSAQFPFVALVCLSVSILAIVRALGTPPLAGDSITYHLLTPTNWLFTHDLEPYFGPGLTAAYGFFPIHGDAWLWWWLAPSHSELYVNLAHFPWWLLLGLATGGVARELGARKTWPSSALLILLLPLLQLYITTQYVDIMLAANLVAGIFFVLRWIREPRMVHALTAGIALALTAGTKTTGLLFAAVLGFAAIVVCRDYWTRRILQLFAATAIIIPLGGIVYLRNMTYGVGPLHPFFVPWLANKCDGISATDLIHPSETIWAKFDSFWYDGIVNNILFGFDVKPYSLGTIAIVLLVSVILLPVFVERARLRLTFVVSLQIVTQLLVFVFLTPISTRVAPMYIRYIFSAIALSLACFCALSERRLGANKGLMRIIVLVIALQLLTYLPHEISLSIRIAVAALTCLLAFPVLYPPFARRIKRYWPGAIAIALLAAILSAPHLARYRQATRHTKIISAEKSYAVRHIPPWNWLDRHDARGKVAVAGTSTFLHTYGVMGMRFQRRATYVNFGQKRYRNVADFNNCDPRGETPSAHAWIGNLKRHQVHWLLIVRTTTEEKFPIEGAWARARPERFRLRYKDPLHSLFAVRLGRETDVPRKLDAND